MVACLICADNGFFLCHFSGDFFAPLCCYFSLANTAFVAGVKEIKEKKTDVFLITLNKSEKDYSPTTMYNDYAVNSTLFHWQTQGKTAEDSRDGQRYIHHAELGQHILLFVREFKNDPWNSTASYTFLGEGTYVRHEGSKPMNILWKLKNAIPAKYLRKVQQVMG